MPVQVHAIHSSTVLRINMDEHIAALTLYECIITTGDEVRIIVWQKKISVPSLFLLSIRWNMILNTIIYLIPGTPQVSS
jgi:hypothetical protein